jgi:hypothetical protein
MYAQLEPAYDADDSQRRIGRLRVRGNAMQAGDYRSCATASASLALALLISGCTTLRPVGGTGAELQSRIVAGELLAAGDRVRLTTAGGALHKVRIESVDFDTGTISGGREAIPVNAVVALEQRVRAPAKTWGLIGGLALLLLGSDCEDDPSCDLGYSGNCC